MEERRYLGDGVYAYFDGFNIWIFTSNGIKESTHIALEPETIAALIKFNADIHGESK